MTTKQNRPIEAVTWQAAATELEARAERFYRTGDIATYNALTVLVEEWRARAGVGQ